MQQEVIEQQEEQPPKKRGRSRRTEHFDAKFVDGLAQGWAFDVPEACRDALDIIYSQYIDKAASTKQRKAYRWVWSRGAPPLRSFDVGHVFYDPPGVRRMRWGEALRVLCRMVQVREAKPDVEGEAEGWVRFEITHFVDGKAVRTEERTLSQAEFETFLRSGILG